VISLNDRVAWRTPLLHDVHGTVIAVREKLGRPIRSAHVVTVRWDYLPGITGPPSMNVDEGELTLLHSESSEVRSAG
jgi:hypothetical protein